MLKQSVVKKLASLFVIVALFGCATTDLSKSSYTKARAVIVLAEVFDEILGCPMELTHKLGDEVPEDMCVKKYGSRTYEKTR